MSRAVALGVPSNPQPFPAIFHVLLQGDGTEISWENISDNSETTVWVRGTLLARHYTPHLPLLDVFLPRLTRDSVLLTSVRGLPVLMTCWVCLVPSYMGTWEQCSDPGKSWTTHRLLAAAALRWLRLWPRCFVRAFTAP